MEEYNLVYNFFETGNTFGRSGFLIATIGIIGLFYSIFSTNKKRVYKIVFCSMFSLFMILWSMSVHNRNYKSFCRIEKLYKSGGFKTVEGVVSNYHLFRLERGGLKETFSVDSVNFSYRNDIAVNGYDIPCAKGFPCVEGGLICKNGQQVKIEYYETLNLFLGEAINETSSNIFGNVILKLSLKKE